MSRIATNIVREPMNQRRLRQSDKVILVVEVRPDYVTTLTSVPTLA
jgi:hypothetical protein